MNNIDIRYPLCYIGFNILPNSAILDILIDITEKREIILNYFSSIINLVYDSGNNISISIILVLISLCIIIVVMSLEKKFRNINNHINHREELFHSLYSNVNDVYIVYDNINKIYEYISPNFEHILGFNSSELDRNITDLFNHLLQEQKKEFLSQFNSSKLTEFTELVFEYHHPITKHRHWLVTRIYPVYKNNEISRYITSVVEVTKEYQAQAEIVEALSNARKANDAKSEFLSHMSHEIKTPINAIIGMTQIAYNSLTDLDKVKSCLEKIDFSSKILISMINNILDAAKHNSNKLILNYEPFHLLRSIAEFSSAMSTQAELKNIDYKLIYHKMGHDYLLGDRLRILQILGNCLSNSFKFTPAYGQITLEISEVEYTKEDGLYRFVISDTGIGMKEDYIRHIFEPFNQEDYSISSRYGGSGLGMSIVKTLLDLMGGCIQIDSKVSQGTTIIIDLRLKTAPTPEEITTTDNPLMSWPEKDFLGMHILVVDDNEINNAITYEYLSSMNIQVDCVTNGYDALQRFEASEEGYYVAILMDLQMPEMNGYDTSRRIRSSKHPDAGRVVILAMTADSLIDHYTFTQYGLNYYITKPIDIDNLNSTLRIIKEKKL